MTKIPVVLDMITITNHPLTNIITPTPHTIKTRTPIENLNIIHILEITLTPEIAHTIVLLQTTTLIIDHPLILVKTEIALLQTPILNILLVLMQQMSKHILLNTHPILISKLTCII